MRSLKQLALASGLALCATFALATGTPANAAPLNAVTAATGVPQLDTSSVSPVEKVRHRRYRRHRHGPRHRSRRGRHRHYYNGYWYAFPWWLHSVPPRYNRCAYWRRQCRIRWGSGRDYRGCVRHHGCRP
ncbi:MAG: hypothetical protein R3287_03190 [Anderseniella sp.]|nr:hypothetical protein [Anderseniella sp.]